jgi:signal peptidase II
MKKYKNIFLSCFSFIFFIFIDQLSKYTIRSRGGFYICNPGISFGVKIPTLMLYPVWSAIFLGLVYLFFKKYPRHSYAILLILTGSFSNLIDRVYYGCVIDFINIKVWPVFNLADSFIFLGVLILIIQINHKNQSKSNICHQK